MDKIAELQMQMRSATGEKLSQLKKEERKLKREGEFKAVELATAAETSTGEDSTRAVTPAGLKTAMSNRPSSATITNIWSGTQAQYNAISPKDSATLYFIK